MGRTSSLHETLFGTKVFFLIYVSVLKLKHGINFVYYWHLFTFFESWERKAVTEFWLRCCLSNLVVYTPQGLMTSVTLEWSLLLWRASVGVFLAIRPSVMLWRHCDAFITSPFWLPFSFVFFSLKSFWLRICCKLISFPRVPSYFLD